MIGEADTSCQAPVEQGERRVRCLLTQLKGGPVVQDEAHKLLVQGQVRALVAVQRLQAEGLVVGNDGATKSAIEHLCRSEGLQVLHGTSKVGLLRSKGNAFFVSEDGDCLVGMESTFIDAGCRRSYFWMRLNSSRHLDDSATSFSRYSGVLTSD